MTNGNAYTVVMIGKKDLFRRKHTCLIFISVLIIIKSGEDKIDKQIDWYDTFYFR